jgi:hypothetical protein
MRASLLTSEYDVCTSRARFSYNWRPGPEQPKRLLPAFHLRGRLPEVPMAAGVERSTDIRPPGGSEMCSSCVVDDEQMLRQEIDGTSRPA